ncbi:DUF393 domain-containing protein [Oceanobacillus piezotolerans]|uniref:DUF393 domain-containing protein n=1 Tax=Oceanobacillus piezotolerans TaxID=2448030 RepID=A0A498D111_9BACI|nr:DUF393 domain-containing protein [Oceanobacillus piezotolerans]RLL39803.1 DUF393 domain-containing protein [Oceanobacillus piezotolerans]
MRKVILFDSSCIFCNKTIHFVLKNDQKKQFDFVALNSPKGKHILSNFTVPPDIDSFFLISNGKIYDRSTAALKVAGNLKGITLTIFLLIPKPIRDIVYKIISRNRHKLTFSSSQHCKIPSIEDRKRFFM